MSVNEKQQVNTAVTEYPVPVLKDGQYAPVTLTRIALEQREDGSASLRFTIRRDIGENVRSFVLRFRFSALPPEEDDPRHAFRDFVFDNPAMNRRELISSRVNIPSGKKIDGCCAYISDIETEDGMTFTYDRTDFAIPVKKEAEPEKPKRRSLNPLWIALPLLAAALVGLGALHTYFAGRRATVYDLMEQGRFNEAYRFAQDIKLMDLRQEVCRGAAEHYLAAGDFADAYVYAEAAPEPFGNAIAVQAAKASFDEEYTTIYPDAFRVAQKMEKETDYDNLMEVVKIISCRNGDYTVAMRAALSMRNKERREEMAAAVFDEGAQTLMATGQDDRAVLFIETYYPYCKNTELDLGSLIDKCTEKGDLAGAIYLSDILHRDVSGFKIVPEDPKIRAELQKVYFLLTPAQKRAYHARTVSISKEAYILLNGTVGGVKNAVSVATKEDFAVVLRTDGTVAAIKGAAHRQEQLPTRNDIVQIAAGTSHTVYLLNDGSVIAYGANDRGQCNVAAWRNIVAVAAGRNFTVGLRADGTLLACGSDACGQCDLSGYHNVVAVEAADQAVVMLFADGTVGIRGDTSCGLDGVSALTDIVSIRAEGTCVIARRADKTFVTVGGAKSGTYGSADKWQDVVDYDVGSLCMGAHCTNGTLYLTGDSKPAK